MPPQTVERLIRELLTISHVTEKHSFFRRSHSPGPYKRVLEHEAGALGLKTFADSRHFDDLLHRLWRLYPDLLNSLQFKTFGQGVLQLILLLKSDNAPSMKNALDTCLGALERLPKRNHRVVREIAGAILSSGPPKSFGNITIYNSALHDDALWNDPHFSPLRTDLGSKAATLAEVNVFVRDRETAVAKADEEFRRFESCISLLVGRDEHRQIAVVRNGPAWTQRFYVQCDESRWNSSGWRGNIVPVDFLDTELLFTPFADALFRISSCAASEWERQVQRALDWLGQAFIETSTASAFIKACIALEAFFTGIEQAPISASVVAKIAENCAFIVADLPDDRLYIEKTVKSLYGTRSAIMHSGQPGVYELELKRLLDICRSLLLRFTLNPLYSKIKSRDDLHELLQGVKYGRIQNLTNPVTGYP